MDKVDIIIRTVDVKDQLSSIKTLIDSFVAKGATAPNSFFTELVQRVTQDDVVIQVSRGAVLYLAQQLSKLPEEKFEEVAQQVLAATKSAPNNLDESEYVIRDALFSLYVKWGQYSDAAQTLANLDLSSAIRPYTDNEKADIYVKCAEAYLEDDASIDAEVFVNKASPLINAVQDIGLQLRYRVTHARVLDSNRKFADAALRYYELSKINTVNVVQEELLELLAKAVTCAILGKTGTQRARVLGLLYKDERLSNLDSIPKYHSHTIVLSKMHKEQIIRKEELTSFEATLQDHQKAHTYDGFTLLEKAVIEHNMLAIGKLYMNILFTELSKLLNIDIRRAEKVAAMMITENRLKASIDQVENLLIFEVEPDPAVIFNAQIADICDEVDKFVDRFNS